MTGGSTDALDEYTISELKRIAPTSLVDFGAGVGKYGTIARSLFGDKVETIGVEAFSETAKALIEKNIYNKVASQEMEQWLDSNTRRYSVAVFGDVLEHVSRRASRRIVIKAAQWFDHIIINVPLENVYQEELDDNPYEIHRGYLVESDFDYFRSTEKHVLTLSEGYRKMNLWIAVPRENLWQSLKRRIKFALLRVFGHAARSLRA